MSIATMKEAFKRTIGSIIPSSYDSKAQKELLSAQLAGLLVDVQFVQSDYWHNRLRPYLVALCNEHNAAIRSAAKDPDKYKVELVGASNRYDAIMEIIAKIEGSPETQKVLQDRIEMIETITRDAAKQADPMFAGID